MLSTFPHESTSACASFSIQDIHARLEILAKSLHPEYLSVYTEAQKNLKLSHLYLVNVQLFLIAHA